MKLLVTTAIIAGTAMSAQAATLSGSIGYGLGAGDRTSLTIFEDLGMPTQTRNVTLSEQINAIAYRPVTGELYGYQINGGSTPDRVFIIDPETGVATDTGAMVEDGANFSGGRSQGVGFDFNNAIDAARAVTIGDENNVFFPDDFGGDNAGMIRQFTDLAYAGSMVDPDTGETMPADTNFGTNPQVFANAYTNAVDGMTSGTTLQYALDAETNSLVTLANNAGTLNTVAPITVFGDDGFELFDFSRIGGLEILSDFEGDNLAIAALRSGSRSGLYTLDLATGIATQFADLGNQRITSFAAQTQIAPVPLPAAGLMLIAALGALRLGSRRRSA